MMKKQVVKKTPAKRKYVRKAKSVPAWAQEIVDNQYDAVSEPLPAPGYASAILTHAAEIVAGSRNSTHGNKERSFQVIADMWNLYLGSRTIPGEITSVNVAQMMELLKIARSIVGLPTEDHFIDSAGYAAIAGQLAFGNKQ